MTAIDADEEAPSSCYFLAVFITSGLGKKEVELWTAAVPLLLPSLLLLLPFWWTVDLSSSPEQLHFLRPTLLAYWLLLMPIFRRSSTLLLLLITICTVFLRESGCFSSPDRLLLCSPTAAAVCFRRAKQTINTAASFPSLRAASFGRDRCYGEVAIPHLFDVPLPAASRTTTSHLPRLNFCFSEHQIQVS